MSEGSGQRCIADGKNAITDVKHKFTNMYDNRKR